MGNDRQAAGHISAAVYAVGDIHGHRDELIAALQAQGLVDQHADWSGGTTKLWFLGDFVDRGPDGIGVIDLVMKLQRQAPDVGGAVESLLGNHEILLLGMHRFDDAQVTSTSGPRSFARSWYLNGGMESDLDSLTDEHVHWLTARPLIAREGDHLLLHSDTEEYLTWGSSIAEINATVAKILTSDDLPQWWNVWQKTTTRYAFRGLNASSAVDRVLSQLGGERIVHGHSVIADQLGIHPSELDGPYLYAAGKVLGIDGGLMVGGPCLVVPLPWEPEE